MSSLRNNGWQLPSFERWRISVSDLGITLFPSDEGRFSFALRIASYVRDLVI